VKTELRFCPACGAEFRPRRIEGCDLPASLSCEFGAWREPKVAGVLVFSSHLPALSAWPVGRGRGA
jgi:hypothetical protein